MNPEGLFCEDEGYCLCGHGCFNPMTAPDPRLGEIEGRANNPFSPENTRAQMDEDRDYLLAELRKVQDALGRVEGLAGPGEQETLATVIAAAEGWERQDLTTDVFADYLQTAAEVLAAGFRKVEQ